MEYIILGHPAVYIKAKVEGRQEWTSQKQEALRYKRTLEIQHLDRPLYTGTLEMTVNFYIGMQKRCASLHNNPHHIKPTLVSLIEFIDHAARGVLFDNECIIATVNAKKFFSTQPRTEFKLEKI